MNRLIFQIGILLWPAVVWVPTARAQNPDLIGFTLLQTVTTNLNGAGIRAAQPEAYDYGTTNWEVNPATVNQPASLFKFTSSAGTSTAYPNSLSGASGHAGGVGTDFYGNPGGVATNVAHVDNYDANYFAVVRYTFINLKTNYTCSLPSTNINDPVINQSFIFTDAGTNVQEAVDTAYDNYAAQYSTLFVSGIGNTGPVSPPSTSYNGIGVGAYGGDSSYGPTLDNGRCKPDITAPATETSYSTPQVAGGAALLMQAALRGDGGRATNSARDIRTVKALLLNGAVKPAVWANAAPSPLDDRYGAGVLNVFNSYEQLTGSNHSFIVSTTVSPTGGAHPPTGAAGTIPVLSGWDFNTNSSGKSPSQFDAVNHYYFNVTNTAPGAAFTATATLVWNRQQNQTAINNLGLFLYNCASSNLVACSTSLVDNVEHVYVPQLAQGRYDLQVWKAGGSGIVSAAEPYALAYAFTTANLSLAFDGTNAMLTWPAYPAGFTVQSTPGLAGPSWSTNNLPAIVFTNGLNRLSLGTTNTQQFFRLVQPNF